MEALTPLPCRGGVGQGDGAHVWRVLCEGLGSCAALQPVGTAVLLTAVCVW